MLHVCDLIETETRIPKTALVETLRRAQRALAEQGDVNGYLDLAKIEAVIVDESDLCCYETPESRTGACDGGERCQEKATRELNRLPYCARHFEKVMRG